MDYMMNDLLQQQAILLYLLKFYTYKILQNSLFWNSKPRARCH